ncbi:MAG TPA: hypothetical protein VFZ16_10360, partial [Hyphomicrobiaceae bacterium]|nr:hypothetical protein [Hyphomicrobiaceae bacterium]
PMVPGVILAGVLSRWLGAGALIRDRRLRIASRNQAVPGAKGNCLDRPEVDGFAVVTDRHAEDYSYLRDPKNWTGAWWEPVQIHPAQ